MKEKGKKKRNAATSATHTYAIYRLLSSKFDGLNSVGNLGHRRK